MKSETCELEFEGCKKSTMVMFEVRPLASRGRNRVACSACWRALTERGKLEQEKPRKNETRLPSVPNRQRSLVK